MSDENDQARILVENIDDEILSRMPGWFRILRETYEKRKTMNIDRHAGKQGKERNS